MIRLLVIFVLIGMSGMLSCNQNNPEHYSDELLSCNYSLKYDSTYNEITGIRLLELFEKDFHPGKANVKEWNNGIQIVGQGGWGEFEYYCSLYNNYESNKLELLYRRKPFGIDTILDYSYELKELSNGEYNDLMKDFIDIEFCEFSFDLEPNSALLDGPAYAVFGKSNDEIKIVTWQGSVIEKSRDREGAVAICPLF